MPVANELREAAAARLVCTSGRPTLSAGMHFLADAEVNAIPLEHFWAWIEPSGSVEAAVLAVKSPGGTALCFASRPTGFGRAEKISRTLRRACDHLQREGVVIAQGLLEPGERGERKVFERAGFQVLAQLSYLNRPLGDSAGLDTVAWPKGTVIETYSPDNHSDFLAALDASYEETRDCPALTGRRSLEDILAGHRATGEFHPSFWMLLRREGRIAGVLLLNPAPRVDAVELVYLGLAKWARGQGLGRLLVRLGIAAASARPEQAMTLAVDERNIPAMRLYKTCGFRRVFRRTALIRPLL